MIRGYLICYRMTQWAQEQSIIVPAVNKKDAYQYAAYTIIPAIEESLAYSVWVQGVILKNGEMRLFNTCEGNPY